MLIAKIPTLLFAKKPTLLFTIYKREQFVKNGNKNIAINQLEVGDLDIEQVIGEIFNQNKDYSKIRSLVFEANKIREYKKCLNPL